MDLPPECLLVPSIQALTRHSQCIHVLTFKANYPIRPRGALYAYAPTLSYYALEPVRCQSLVELNMSFSSCSNDSKEPWHGVTLVSMNQGLLKLSIGDYQTFSIRPWWGPMFQQCSRSVRELDLYGVNLNREDADQLLGLAASLRVLLIENSRIHWSGTFLVEPQFPSMESLQIKNVEFDAPEHELEWKRQCPLVIPESQVVVAEG
ncbi:hypothetical protein BGZ83_002704 [Gryganskiella cystojenkinii]|nr:hypothetical protein BGZ83_002704 [Gryganskiella cystojenkinii]